MVMLVSNMLNESIENFQSLQSAVCAEPPLSASSAMFDYRGEFNWPCCEWFINKAPGCGTQMGELWGNIICLCRYYKGIQTTSCLSLYYLQWVFDRKNSPRPMAFPTQNHHVWMILGLFMGSMLRVVKNHLKLWCYLWLPLMDSSFIGAHKTP